MWPFTSSNSNPEPTPTRSERQTCWSHRDAYFSCLDVNSIVKPGSEPSSICSKEKKNYEGSCLKSWVEHFNTRRVVTAKQAPLLAERERQMKAVVEGTYDVGARVGAPQKDS